MIGRQWFMGDGIQPGGAQVSGLQRREQGALIHQLAAGGVNQHRAGRHQRQRRGVEHTAGFIVYRAVQAEHVGPGQQVGEAGAAAGACGIGIAGDGRIEKGHVHAKRLRHFRHPAADFTVAYQAEGFTAQLLAVAAAGPAACGHLLLEPGQAAGAAEHQRHGQLGYRLRVGGGRRQDRNALPGSGLNVDIGHADAVLADNFQRRAGGDGAGAEGHRP